MMTTINERFASLITELRLSNNAFAKSLGKSSTTINYIVDGKNKPGFDVLEGVLSTYPQVNPDWLMRGSGEMFTASDRAATLANSAEDAEFGERVLDRVSQGIDELKRFFEEELKVKNQQIAGLQRTVDVPVGKSKGVSRRPNVNPKSSNLKNTNMYHQVPVFN